MKKLDKNFRIKKADFEQMKKDIGECLQKTSKPLTYEEVAQRINSDEYTVFNIVGIYFKDLVGDALSKVSMHNMPHDDFYLYFNKLEQINSNRWARIFFKKIDKAINRNIKLMDFKGRLKV